ncbi:unnamed protein product [Urochloa humidicola]
MLSRLLPHRRTSTAITAAATSKPAAAKYAAEVDLHQRLCSTSSVSSPSLSMLQRKKDMGKEGLMGSWRWRSLSDLRCFHRTGPTRAWSTSRARSGRPRTDLLSVLAELLRQDHVSSRFLDIWCSVERNLVSSCHPDMYLCRDMRTFSQGTRRLIRRGRSGQISSLKMCYLISTHRESLL